MDYTEIIIPFIGGLAMFIFGMNYMAQGLQNVAGSKMRSILEVLTQNKALGVALGAMVTAIVQSSSATTVMVVGFVNATLMNLSQAMSIIMGANIGTTITSWVASSSEWAKFLSPTTIAPLAVMAGVIMQMMSEKSKQKDIASILIGFGFLFVGMDMMSDGVAPLRTSPVFVEAFITLGKNPILAILAGAGVTAIIQSSSAAQGILLSLAAVGLVPANAAIFIIMGQNIGTCITALLSGIGAGKNAKCVGYMHLMFNLIGTGIFSFVAWIYFYHINVEMGASVITQTQISIVHTIFNVGTTLLLFPFSDKIIQVVMKLNGLTEDGMGQEDVDFVHLDKRMAQAPALAIEEAKQETLRMGQMAKENMELALEAVFMRDEEKIQKTKEAELAINKVCHGISNYLVQMCSISVGEKENQIIIELLGILGDLERVGDHAENIAEIAETMIKYDVYFSDDAKEEIQMMQSAVQLSLEKSFQSFMSFDVELANTTKEAEERVDKLEKKLRSKHISRVSKGHCSTTAGIYFLELLSNMERISDHAMNVAEVVFEASIEEMM